MHTLEQLLLVFFSPFMSLEIVISLPDARSRLRNVAHGWKQDKHTGAAHTLWVLINYTTNFIND